MTIVLIVLKIPWHRLDMTKHCQLRRQVYKQTFNNTSNLPKIESNNADVIQFRVILTVSLEKK